MQAYRRLTAAQEQTFLDQGYIHIPQALDRDFAAAQVAHAWVRLGMDPKDPATWTEERLHMSSDQSWLWREQAPIAWDYICDLLGGEERVKADARFGNGMVMNFCQGRGLDWEPPAPTCGGWHKDGNFFHHFLDSPEQALLAIIIWQDIAPRAGGTFIAPDSVGVIARLLAQHPEGLTPGGFNTGVLIHECRDFREVTGQAGDVVLLHPYMLHTASRNPSGIARLITNPNVNGTAPFCFDREDPAAYALVERCVLRGLGVERFPFHITGERRRYEATHTKKYEDYLKSRQAS